MPGLLIGMLMMLV